MPIIPSHKVSRERGGITAVVNNLHPPENVHPSERPDVHSIPSTQHVPSDVSFSPKSPNLSGNREVQARYDDLSSGGRKERSETLAINLFDAEKLHPLILGKLLKGKVDLTKPIWLDRNDEKETIILFVCSLLEAALIVDMLRSEDRRMERSITRCYLRRKEVGKWYKLTEDTILTRVGDDGHSILFPGMFPVMEDGGITIPYEPLPVARLPKPVKRTYN